MTNSSTPLEQIKAALTALAIFRQAKLDATTRDLYAKRLAQEQAIDVIPAIEKIQELPREEGQTALPELGVILAMARTMEVARHNREESVRDMLVSRWECPKCGTVQSGHVSPFDNTPRICRSQYDGKPRQKAGTAGRHCDCG